MEQSFLIDTNIVIDVFGNAMPHSVKQKVKQMIPVVSAVTYMEALGWYRASQSQLNILEIFMENATILSINKPVIEATIRIRQQKKIGLGDAIIAATAIVHNRILVTRNEDDFKSIDNLQLYNPWK